MRSRSAVVALTCLLTASACGDLQTTVQESAAHQDPAQIRLFYGGIETTAHIPVNTGTSLPVEVRLYAANGARLVGFDDHFRLTGTMDPTTLGHAAPASGSTLVLDVTVVAPPETHGTLRITVEHLDTGTTRTFGPFEVLAH